MAPYQPTTWVNDQPPPLSAQNLNKLTDELRSQALNLQIANSLPTWANGAPPALTNPDPLNEMERVASVAAIQLGLSYAPTSWSTGWTPARNAVNLNRLEDQARLNRVEIDLQGLGYPASYFNGPLGQNNMLPPKLGAFLMLFPNDASAAAETWAQRQARVIQREQDCSRIFDSVHCHFPAGTYAGQANCLDQTVVNESRLDWCKDHSRIVTVSWSPNRTIADVNAGLVDPCIDAVADYLAVRPYRIMLRLFWEFNLGHTYTGTGQLFIDAWRRVVTRFQTRGATNVGFWWCPYEINNRLGVNASYPGDSYVDWVGSDIYNVCANGDTNCWSTYCDSGWQSFRRIALYTTTEGTWCGGGANPDPDNLSIHSRFGPSKPFVIGETNTRYDAAVPASKGDWYRALAAGAQQGSYLRGVTIYDADVSAVPGDTNYRVEYPTSNPDAYAGFQTMAADPWFNTYTT